MKLGKHEAQCILAAAKAIVDGDSNEAYHQLYKIAQPDFSEPDTNKVWLSIENIANGITALPNDPVEKDLESINTQMSKEEIAKKHIAAYYRNRGKNVSLDDILPMSRIYPMMEEYAQAKIKLLSQPPTGWISVEERLPPSFINVLVPMEAGLFIAHYDNLSGLWKDFNYEPINVTHWMPLPAPPETK